MLVGIPENPTLSTRIPTKICPSDKHTMGKVVPSKPSIANNGLFLFVKLAFNVLVGRFAIFTEHAYISGYSPIPTSITALIKINSWLKDFGYSFSLFHVR